MYPLNFDEYLKAINKDIVSEHLNTVPVKPIAHHILLELFHRYAIIGGMPEIIKVYLQNNNISDLSSIYESIWGTYKDDVAKYSSNANDRKIIKYIISTAHLYLDERIKFH